MALPGSSDGGKAFDGSEEVRVSVYMTEGLYETLEKMSIAVNCSSVTSVVEMFLKDYSAQISDRTEPIKKGIRLINKYRSSIDKEVDKPSIERGMCKLDSGELCKEVKPDVGPEVSGIISKISTGLSCTTATSCRIILFKAIKEFYEEAGDEVHMIPNIDDCVDMWDSLDQRITEFYLDFEMFVKSKFRVHRDNTSEKLSDYPGVARDFAKYYYLHFKDGEGEINSTYTKLKDKVGGDNIDTIDEVLVESIGEEVVSDIKSNAHHKG